ncbi:MAG: response regulator [Proteobacteria bacterium]|nr:response regulator [Pseudomonadota bacterium]
MGAERILVVDDEDHVSKLLMALLEYRGYENVQIACNGHEGLAKYKENRPNLVLMDLEMPVMNGYDSSREIKRYDPTANIVLITANPQSPFAQRIIREGYASQVLPKPFSFEELLETIKQSLDPPSPPSLDPKSTVVSKGVL